MVDLLGRYSNRDNLSRLNRILSGQGRDTPSHRPVPSLHQKQTRLAPQKVDELVVAYERGSTLEQLAAEYLVDAGTAAKHLERRGVSRRGRKLSDEQIAEAVDL